MAKRDVATLACRILGLYFATTTLAGLLAQLPSFAMFYDPLYPAYDRLHQLMAFTSHALPFALGVVLLLLARRIAGSLLGPDAVRDDQSAPVVVDSSLTDIQAAAFSVLGAFVCARALSGLVTSALRLGRDSSFYALARLTGPDLALLAVGLYLLLGARGLVGVLRKLRTFGDVARGQPPAPPSG